MGKLELHLLHSSQSTQSGVAVGTEVVDVSKGIHAEWYQTATQPATANAEGTKGDPCECTIMRFGRSQDVGTTIIAGHPDRPRTKLQRLDDSHLGHYWLYGHNVRRRLHLLWGVRWWWWLLRIRLRGHVDGCWFFHSFK